MFWIKVKCVCVCVCVSYVRLNVRVFMIDDIIYIPYFLLSVNVFEYIHFYFYL